MEAAQISSLTGQTEVRAGGEVISIKSPQHLHLTDTILAGSRTKEQPCTPAAGEQSLPHSTTTRAENSWSIACRNGRPAPGVLTSGHKTWIESMWTEWSVCVTESQNLQCHHYVFTCRRSTSISLSCHSLSLGCALPPAVWEVHSPPEIIKYALGDNVSFIFKLVGLQSFSDSLWYSDKQVDPEMGITFHYVLICTPYGFSAFYLSKCYIAEENQKQQSKQNP